MKYLKLFEEMKINWREFPWDGHRLSPRERKILTDLVGEYLDKFIIRIEDNYYYTKFSIFEVYYLNRFDGFNELKDYILSKYYMYFYKSEKLLELLKTSDIDPSFDGNLLIKWASNNGKIEIVKHVLNDSRTDPSVDDNHSIKWASSLGNKEILKLLLNDERVRSKLSDSQINKYTNEIS